MVRKKSRSELEIAEIKLQTLLEKRDGLNEEARAIRSERDLLNDKKRELSSKIRELKAERDASVKEMREHRDRRNELQAKARELIALRRRFRGKVRTSVAEDIRRIRSEISQMEMRQQTSSLDLPEENRLLGDLKRRMRDLQELEGLKVEQDKVVTEVKELDGAIDDLFKAAEVEHRKVLELNERSHGVHLEVVKLGRSMATLVEEADKRHEEFLGVKQHADHFHERARELRETLMQIRGDQRREGREAGKLLRDQNRAVREALLNEAKLDAAAEAALETLRKRGKVEMKG